VHGSIRSWKEGSRGEDFKIYKSVDQGGSTDFDALLSPGGVINTDKLRTDMILASFVKSFFKKHKPDVTICHGPQMLIEA
jgi:protease I